MNAQSHHDRPALRLVPLPGAPENGPQRRLRAPATAALSTGETLAATGLTVTHRDRGATWLMTLAGEADLSSRDELVVGLQYALQKEPDALVVDVSGLEFCDSRSATTVIEANRNSPDTDIVLVGTHGVVGRVFDLLDPRQTLARHG